MIPLNPGQIVDLIRRLPLRPAKFMEVCGTHTFAIFRAGIRNTLLAERGIELVSGPGCPVCVTAAAEIDQVAQLALADPNIILTAFGDIFRAKGHKTSFADARAQGADVRMVLSPHENIAIAEENPSRLVVFFSIGFETTQPGIAHTVKEAHRHGLGNFSIYASHKLVAPVLSVLAQDPRLKLDGFILPGHVSSIIGEEPYQFLAREYGLPGVIAGFEPVDILAALYQLLAMREEGKPRIINSYRAAVPPQGNQKALALIDEIFTPADTHWRGIGTIPLSGHRLKPQFIGFDAHERFGLPRIVEDEAGFGACRCGEVLLGLIKPTDCPLFGESCTSDSPLGACMVSGEGACANYFKYGERR
jgi:hydrogenase expression/formation protein HypD